MKFERQWLTSKQFASLNQQHDREVEGLQLGAKSAQGEESRTMIEVKYVDGSKKSKCIVKKW